MATWSYCLECDFLFPGIVSKEARGCDAGSCVIVPVPDVRASRTRKRPHRQLALPPPEPSVAER